MSASQHRSYCLDAPANNRVLKGKVIRSPCKTQEAEMKNVLFAKQCRELKKASRITPEYAYELLLSEMDLELRESVSKALVARMFELYKIGVEYYNFRQDPREGYFKRKAQYLSNHPLVLDLLHRQNERQDNFYKKKHIQRLVELNKKDTFIDVQEMLKKVDQVGKKNGQTIQRSLSLQLQDIHRRLQYRKQTTKLKDCSNHPEVFQDKSAFNEDGQSTKPSESTKVSFNNTDHNSDQTHPVQYFRQVSENT